MRLAAQAKGGFYPTPDRVVDMIADLIGTPSGYYYHNRETLRVLDPCCGVGDAVDRLAQRLHGASAIPVETYGVELHRDRGLKTRRGASTAPWQQTYSGPPSPTGPLASCT